MVRIAPGCQLEIRFLGWILSFAGALSAIVGATRQAAMWGVTGRDIGLRTPLAVNPLVALILFAPFVAKPFGRVAER